MRHRYSYKNNKTKATTTTETLSNTNLINYYHAHSQLMFLLTAKWFSGSEWASKHHRQKERESKRVSVCGTLDKFQIPALDGRLIYDTAIFFWKFITKFIFNQHNVLNELSISVIQARQQLVRPGWNIYTHRHWILWHWEPLNAHERDK